jgi:hypothetical protein
VEVDRPSREVEVRRLALLTDAAAWAHAAGWESFEKVGSSAGRALEEEETEEEEEGSGGGVARRGLAPPAAKAGVHADTPPLPLARGEGDDVIAYAAQPVHHANRTSQRTPAGGRSPRSQTQACQGNAHAAVVGGEQQQLPGLPFFALDVACGGGTYVRSLIDDVATHPEVFE